MNLKAIWTAAVALSIAAVAAQAAPRDGLAVRLSVDAPVVRGNVDVVVKVSVTNTTVQPIELLRWELPTPQHESTAFRITRDGQPVAYTGKLVKRAEPTREDYVRIEAGATLSYEVELTAAYDLARNGTYTIEYVGKGARDASTGTARSEPMYLWLESRTARARAPTAPAPPDVSISYTGNCSAARISALEQAVAAATVYANGAYNYFNAHRGSTQRYRQWFGIENRARFATARTHFASILDAFANKPLTLDCSCTDSYYAYVYANQPYKIYACNAFWAAPMTGTDSKAGTLIHEMSHFTVVAGTDDWAYGQTAAAALAISNPTNALNNADSHEYFAENTPGLP